MDFGIIEQVRFSNATYGLIGLEVDEHRD